MTTNCNTNKKDWQENEQRPRAEEIINGLALIPKEWELTPLIGKVPFLPKWQVRKVDREDLARWIRFGGLAYRSEDPNDEKAKKVRKQVFSSGYGLLTGVASDNILAIDFDGASSAGVFIALAKKWGKEIDEQFIENLKNSTVSFTSGKPGRFQLLFSLPEHLNEFGSHNIASDVKGEQLEIRFNGRQSVLPPSYHPTTGAYSWITPPDESKPRGGVVEAPKFIQKQIEAILSGKHEAAENRAKNLAEQEERLKQGCLNLRDVIEKVIEARLSPRQLYPDIKWIDDPEAPNAIYGRGESPLRPSASGSGFTVAKKGDRWLFTENGLGIKYSSAIHYWGLLEYGVDSGFPKGKRYVELAQKMAAVARVRIEDYLAPKGSAITELDYYMRSLVPKHITAYINGIFRSFHNSFQRINKHKVVDEEDLIKEHRKQEGVIIYDLPEDRIETYNRLLENPDIKMILDISLPGTGKTTVVGNAKISDFPFLDCSDPENPPKIIYVAQSPRNPFTESIESNFPYIEPRHCGDLVEDESRKTPLGRNKLVYGEPIKGNLGNCDKAKYHRIAQEKNLDLGGSWNERGKGDRNPICMACEHLEACGGAVVPGLGYGFKYSLKQGIKQETFSANFQGLPEINLKNSVLFIDEMTQAANPVVTYNVSFSELNDNLAEVSHKLRFSGLPRHADRLIELKTRLESLAMSAGKYGIPLDEIKGTVQSVLLDIGSYADNRALSTLETTNRIKALCAMERALKIKESPESFKQRVAGDYLFYIHEILAGRIQGSVRLYEKSLVLTLPNEKLARHLEDSMAVVVLEAYTSKEEIALLYGLKPEQIAVCKVKDPDISNLEIKQITGLGLLGRDRSDSLKESIEILRAKLVELHGEDIGFIDYKDYIKKGELAHLSDSRGSNEYANKKALAIIGTAIENLSALQDIYQSVMGKVVDLNQPNEEFQRFVSDRTQRTLLQEIGRLRASLRNESLVCYIISEYDLSFFHAHGLDYSVLPVEQIEPEAVQKSVKIRLKLIESALELVEKEDSRLTLSKVIKNAGYSPARGTQLAKEIFGEDGKAQDLMGLIYELTSFPELTKGKPVDVKELREELRFYAKVFIPGLFCFSEEELKQEIEPEYEEHKPYLPNLDTPDTTIGALFESLNSISKTYGKDAANMVVKSIPWRTRIKAITKLISLASSSYFDEFFKGLLIFSGSPDYSQDVVNLLNRKSVDISCNLNYAIESS